MAAAALILTPEELERLLEPPNGAHSAQSATRRPSGANAPLRDGGRLPREAPERRVEHLACVLSGLGVGHQGIAPLTRAAMA